MHDGGDDGGGGGGGGGIFRLSAAYYTRALLATIGELPGLLIATAAIDRLGRRDTAALCALLAALALGALALSLLSAALVPALPLPLALPRWGAGSAGRPPISPPRQESSHRRLMIAYL